MRRRTLMCTAAAAVTLAITDAGTASAHAPSVVAGTGRGGPADLPQPIEISVYRDGPGRMDQSCQVGIQTRMAEGPRRAHRR
ncbi:hypothetical protein Ate02nite_94760 [Paractinoplanes tereljensis]|uniref:Uncharacterized protein n=1 Tax=Paractinoplanes tereljensis TaxID=571912 RepID=A0A919NWR6_9ACTN|nr:hypothetical protein Ate02nite_94760 [Actinoplanes tereljensis]